MDVERLIWNIDLQTLFHGKIFSTTFTDLSMDFAIETFKCLKSDEHLITGRESRVRSLWQMYVLSIWLLCEYNDWFHYFIYTRVWSLADIFLCKLTSYSYSYYV